MILSVRRPLTSIPLDDFRGSHKYLPVTLKFFGERGPGVIFFVALFSGFLAAAKYDGPAPDS